MQTTRPSQTCYNLDIVGHICKGSRWRYNIIQGWWKLLEFGWAITTQVHNNVYAIPQVESSGFPPNYCPPISTGPGIVYEVAFLWLLFCNFTRNFFFCRSRKFSQIPRRKAFIHCYVHFCFHQVSYRRSLALLGQDQVGQGVVAVTVQIMCGMQLRNNVHCRV